MTNLDPWISPSGSIVYWWLLLWQVELYPHEYYVTHVFHGCHTRLQRKYPKEYGESMISSSYYFWKSIFKQQLGCRFDIMDSISSFFFILTYAIIYVLIHHIFFWIYLYFFYILYFFKYLCINILHRRSPCTFDPSHGYPSKNLMEQITSLFFNKSY